MDLAIAIDTIERDLRLELSKLDALRVVPPSEEIIRQCEASIAFAAGAADSPSSVLVGARARYEKARVLSMLERKDESRAVVRDILARYEQASDPEVRRVVCRALFGQTKDRLAEGADRRSAIAEYRLVLHVAERAPPIDDMAASALYHLALTNGKIAIERENAEHREKAIDRFREIERRFGTHRDVDVARWVARSALAHGTLVPLERASAIYEALFRRHAKDISLELRTHAAEALTCLAERCLEEGEAEKASTLAKRVRETFAGSDHPPIRDRVQRCERFW